MLRIRNRRLGSSLFVCAFRKMNIFLSSVNMINITHDMRIPLVYKSLGLKLISGDHQQPRAKHGALSLWALFSPLFGFLSFTNFIDYLFIGLSLLCHLLAITSCFLIFSVILNIIYLKISQSKIHLFLHSLRLL